jgi:HEPN domain-containing protein
MGDKYDEWLKQADYDMGTADAMHGGGRYFYAVFMSHLSIEKALKGLYYKVLDQMPPKTHNLLYLLNKIDKKPEQELERFIIKLNTASIATRYPDDLAKIQAVYTEEVAKDIINKSKDLLKWIKMQF